MLGKRDPLAPNSSGPILRPLPPNVFPRFKPLATALLSRKGEEAGTGLEAVEAGDEETTVSKVTFPDRFRQRQK